ncbi:MAG TPA: phosphoribosyltransferase family protein [Dehalococcoidia bacterium]|nr:phosphoribosyltransferase family protein [Dehalococcoidia bacterium]
MNGLRTVYQHAGVVFSGRFETTVNELTDQLPALRPEIMAEAADEILRIGDFDCDKLLVEEEKGAALGGVVALKAGLPLAMARRYNYDIPSFKVPLESEYIEGHLYVNGIQPGDRVIVIDDTISTGGTLIALLRAVRELGAVIHDVVALVEKVDNHGVERVLKETGITVKTLLKIQIVDGRVVVL